MSQKYEFTGETKEWMGRTLHRIRAVRDIAALGIVAGMLGGWIESEGNLSQVYGDAWVYGNAQVSGDAWVYGNAQVSGNAWVYGNAQVSGNAQVYGDARVSGNAWVYGDAWVYGNAQVSGDAWVYGNAQVSGNAQVYGDARVSGNARVTPITITGLRWTVTIADQDMAIGCQQHSIERWWGFNDRVIAKMDGAALEFWQAHKATLQALCAATGRPFSKGAEA